MAISAREMLKVEREHLARMQDAVAAAERGLTNAIYCEKIAQEDVDAWEATAAGEAGVVRLDEATS